MDYLTIQCKDKQRITISHSELCDNSGIMKDMILLSPKYQSITFHFSFHYNVMSYIVNVMKGSRPPITSVRHAMDIYDANTKVGAKNVNRNVRRYLHSAVTIKTVCAIHDFACRYKEIYIEYTCWIQFDHHWKDIFFSNYHFECEATTIDRLVSRPVYQTLDELNLFWIVYDWASRKAGTTLPLRSVMKPYLQKIRFLAMDPENIEENLFHKIRYTVLSEEDIRGIKHYHSTGDVSRVPCDICSYTFGRSEKFYRRWFTYLSRRKFGNEREIPVNENTKFASEIFVLQDCFVTPSS
ncbi:uncharacterized protein LOC111623117 [Centruroides sculpturatus]|uniref:uncharacterized protein LOC111623117 n=1 Tax=Centruroides sculpturatus TaxID=218467 RepID=UPI000C6D3435|nr:uncharacterized protein LOC111623117 [Centruroides sculpturatus]